MSTRADGGATLPQLDTPEVLYERPANAECAQALGVVDLIAAQAAGDRAQTALGEARLLEPASGPVVLVARPERLQFVPTDDGAATVVRVVYQGHRYLLELDSPAGGVTVQARGEPPARGTRGHVRFREPCWVLPREGP
jgi:iron(III) transport system ATP-binding protein